MPAAVCTVAEFGACCSSTFSCRVACGRSPHRHQAVQQQQPRLEVVGLLFDDLQHQRHRVGRLAVVDLQPGEAEPRLDADLPSSFRASL